MDSLFQDLRVGARALLKQPGSTGLSILAFGLGMGLFASLVPAHRATRVEPVEALK